MEFPLKPGKVTLARLSQADGNLQLVVGRGQMIASPPSFSGTSGTIQFERPVRDVVETVLGNGLEHHISIVYGDYLSPLLAFARLMDLPILHL